MRRFGSPKNRNTLSPALSSQFDENVGKSEQIEVPDQETGGDGPAVKTRESNHDVEKAAQQKLKSKESQESANAQQLGALESLARLAEKTNEAQKEEGPDIKRVPSTQPADEHPGSSQTLNQQRRSPDGKTSPDEGAASRTDNASH